VWDIRGTGCCLRVVLDHHADVYDLCCHATRPFLLTSTSRDTTLRVWSCEMLVRTRTPTHTQAQTHIHTQTHTHTTTHTNTHTHTHTGTRSPLGAARRPGSNGAGGRHNDARRACTLVLPGGDGGHFADRLVQNQRRKGRRACQSVRFRRWNAGARCSFRARARGHTHTHTHTHTVEHVCLLP